MNSEANRPGDDGGDAAAAIAEVLAFWFDEAGPARWFAVDPAFDQQIQARFAGLQQRAGTGALAGWAATSDGALALTILLDQFPRNLHRGDPQAFADDPHARRVADAALAQGFDEQQPIGRRQFFYLPFMHSEDLADQERSVRLYAAIRDQGDAESYDYAVRHRDVVARFGRFPHRNKVLGRSSTDAEQAFLATPGASF